MTGTLVQYRALAIRYIRPVKRLDARVCLNDLRSGKKKWLPFIPNRGVADQAEAYLSAIGITLDGIVECGPHKGPLLLTRDLITPLR